MRKSPFVAALLFLLWSLALPPADAAAQMVRSPVQTFAPHSDPAENDATEHGGAAPALHPRATLPQQPEVIRSNSEWRERDKWQRPHDLMDELALGPGAAVADVGAGRGYFSFHLAERVGPEGRVFSVDIDERELQRLRRYAERYSYSQIEPVLGQPDDPKLPPGQLDAVLVVNAFHEFRAPGAMLDRMRQALKPGGLLAIVDRDAEPGEPRDAYHQRHSIPETLVRDDAERHGFRLLRRPVGFVTDLGREWYFLVFEKTESGKAEEEGGRRSADAKPVPAPGV
jgi:predicted methyltransferase